MKTKNYAQDWRSLQEEGARQIGGSHYSNMPIEPIAYILANNIGFSEGNIIKYVSRWKVKNGIEDLKKARHYLDILILTEYAARNEKDI